MASQAERLQILKMIENGIVSAEEGARLLEALEGPSSDPKSASGKSARWFRVRVTDTQTGKDKVNMNIPLGLVNVGMRMGAKFAPDVAGADVQELLRAVRLGVQGKVIDIQSNEDGERVEIYVD
jgi:hypothetical protein